MRFPTTEWNTNFLALAINWTGMTTIKLVIGGRESV